MLKEYNGKKVYIHNGYYSVYYPEHPNATKDGNIMLHVLIASNILQRELRGEVVHHKDFNRLNNDENNLMIFHSNADHAAYHQMLNGNDDMILYNYGKIYFCCQLKDFLKENKKTQKPKKNIVSKKSNRTYKIYVKPCPNCGKLINVKSKMCIDCYNFSERRVKRPIRTQLKQLIKTKSFLEIGKMYGVSDNAIRKWCKKYNLPYKSTDIKNIKNKDWKYL